MERNGYCAVGGGSLYYEALGDGEPVVLIQGFGLNQTYWDGLAAALSADHLAVTYDRRGFGRSSDPRQDVPYSDFADLAELLDLLELTAVHIVSECVGAQVALEFTLENPSRVRSLVLSNPDAGPGVAGVNEAFFKIVEDTREAYAAGALDQAVERALPNPIVAPSIRNEDNRFRLIRAMAGFRGWHFLHWYPRKGCVPPVADRLEEIDVPTLVISGGQDYVYFRRTADTVAARVPGARIEHVSRAGHFAFIDAADVVEPMVRDFVSRVTE